MGQGFRPNPSGMVQTAATRRSWVLRGVAGGVAEEARTRGFASLTLVSSAFLENYYEPPHKAGNSGMYVNSEAHAVSLAAEPLAPLRLDVGRNCLQSSLHNLPLLSHLFMARRFDEALEEERLEFEQRGDIVLLAALEEGFEAAGPTGAMRALAEELVDRAQESYVNPFFIGETFARAEMVDEALYWLDQAAGHGSYNMTYLAYWPPFDVLRDDPRYQQLLQRVYGDRPGS